MAYIELKHLGEGKEGRGVGSPELPEPTNTHLRTISAPRNKDMIEVQTCLWILGFLGSVGCC